MKPLASVPVPTAHPSASPPSKTSEYVPDHWQTFLTEQSESLERNGAFNRGWYGGRELADEERANSRSNSAKEQAASEQRYHSATTAICRTYLANVTHTPDITQQIVPSTFLFERMVFLEPRSDIDDSKANPSYSIITPFYAHHDFFRRCAKSVAALIRTERYAHGSSRVEWVVVNDDPRYSAHDIRAMIPEDLRSFIQVLSDGLNKGIVARLNEGIERTASDWLLFLDCDDLIEAEATFVLDHYIEQFPRCRYISSAIIDIDEQDNVLRFRRHHVPPCTLFHNGMVASHLKAVRRDLVTEVGAYRPEFSGCQDYEFALRVAVQEPLLLIPEYLYRYRWHCNSQSVEAFSRQEAVATFVRREFLRRFAEERLFAPTPRANAAPLKRRGLCVLRTQGRRLELLSEAIQSIRRQTVPITPCVVVHGDPATSGEVERWMRTAAPDAVFLRALDVGRRRGYPLNLALDFLREHSHRFGFFCFLDDDDIVYPLYAERLIRSLESTGADVAFCLSNKRVAALAPEAGPKPLPPAALVAGNFIPIHCHVVRTDLLVRSGARIREDMDYLEDWDFLLALLAAGGRFAHLPEVLCEYRVTGDGNTAVKRDPEHYEECRERVFARGRSAARKLGLGSLFRDLADFDFAERPALAPEELGHLFDSRHIFMGEADLA
jgi:glycosyltransferase involved in cell wall biosynthesis